MKTTPQDFLEIDTLSSRLEVNYLEKEIIDSAKRAHASFVDFDLQDILHISRSAADELLAAQQRVRAHGIKLNLSNLNDFNSRMLEMVAERVAKPSASRRKIQRIPVSELALSES